MTAAVVLGAGHIALTLVRSLGRRSIRSTVVRTDKTARAVTSRYCATHVRWPADAEAHHRIEFLLRLAA